ncbi:MAG: hypothetical protein K6E36_11340 [Oscillospiraceae bacterium]|nr:hypothetical protein [Oscillospiraceae bacterium]
MAFNPKQVRVLIGTGNEKFAITLADQLKSHGYWVFHVLQTKENLEFFIRHEHPDVLILDPTFPTLDFADFIKKLLAVFSMEIYVIEEENDPLSNAQLDYKEVKFWRSAEHSESFADFFLKSHSPFVSMIQQSYYECDMFIINTLLHRSGIPPRLTGYSYIQQGLYLIVSQKCEWHSCTSRLYDIISEYNSNSPSAVERSIRTAIEHMPDRGENKLSNSDLFNLLVSEFYAMKGIPPQIGLADKK